MNVDVEVYVDDVDVHPVRAGVLRPSFSGGRVLASSSFEYDPAYLGHPHRYAISADLPLVSGRRFAPADRAMFGAFTDSAPDEWGRKIIEADNAARRRLDPSLPARPSEFDFLLSVSDATRAGALRFRRAGVDSWLADDSGVANIHDLDRVLAAAWRYESDEATDEDVAYLSDVATSPGGARPKANVELADGRLAIAKLPHSKDGEFDVESWEALALTIASRAGIRVPAFSRVRASPSKAVLVSHRFDREGGRRRGYVSAATAMELGDRDSGSASYEDFAETIAELARNPRPALREMFARVALTVLINNVDDHWRNHGFLREDDAWILAPAFDLNPSRLRGVLNSRRISADDDPRRRDLRNLMATAGSYGLSKAEATRILRRVGEQVARWRDVAHEFHLPEAQVERMAVAFDEDQREYALA